MTLFKPVDQTTFYDEEKGTRGDCMSACIASLFGLPLDAVPRFIDAGPGRFWESILEFCEFGGWQHECHGDPAKVPPDTYCIVSGKSPRNDKITHAVIYLNGKMVHDPHPDRTGILDERNFNWFIPIPK